jgi:hypothetical protein
MRNILSTTKLCWPWYAWLFIYDILLFIVELVVHFLTKSSFENMIVHTLVLGTGLSLFFWYDAIRYRAYKTEKKIDAIFNVANERILYDSLKYNGSIFYVTKIDSKKKSIMKHIMGEKIYFRLFSFAICTPDIYDGCTLIIKSSKVKESVPRHFKRVA